MAFHLYKSRHFKVLDAKVAAPTDEDNFQGDDKKDFRYQLLQTANAKLIGPTGFRNIIDKAVEMGWKLDNKILNLPSALENEMH